MQSILFLLAAVLVVADVTVAQVRLDPTAPDFVGVYETDDGVIVAADSTSTYVFENWREYVGSEFFKVHDMRCGQPKLQTLTGGLPLQDGSQSDCSDTNTNAASEYNPSGGVLYRVPVVFHVITHKNGNGNVSDARIAQEMQVLNEDFRAIAGSLGGNGNDTRIEFFLATEDPDGNPTTGITRHQNNKWYNDQLQYWNAIGWDTSRYLNIYTNTAGGSLGYAFVPSGGGIVGHPQEGVRLYWPTVGNPAPYGPPYHLARTGTHEVGHWMGLYHTFDGGCATGSAPACNSNGDLICDTNPEQTSMFSGSCSRSTCGSSDPTNNYMDYSDDICMEEFTSNQAYRMRCTAVNFRFDMFQPGNAAPVVAISSPADPTTVDEGDPVTFAGAADDAEDGDITGSISWSSSRDGIIGSGSGFTTSGLSAGTHVVTATATDSGGKSGSDTVTVTVLSTGGATLTADIYKVKGKITVDLFYSGLNGTNVEVWRDGVLIGTVGNSGAATHNTGLKGSGSWTYKVCEIGGTVCTNEVTVSI
jgi:hypothetical protein